MVCPMEDTLVVSINANFMCMLILVSSEDLATSESGEIGLASPTEDKASCKSYWETRRGG